MDSVVLEHIATIVPSNGLPGKYTVWHILERGVESSQYIYPFVWIVPYEHHQHVCNNWYNQGVAIRLIRLQLPGTIICVMITYIARLLAFALAVLVLSTGLFPLAKAVVISGYMSVGASQSVLFPRAGKNNVWSQLVKAWNTTSDSAFFGPRASAITSAALHLNRSLIQLFQMPPKVDPFSSEKIKL